MCVYLCSASSEAFWDTVRRAAGALIAETGEEWRLSKVTMKLGLRVVRNRMTSLRREGGRFAALYPDQPGKRLSDFFHDAPKIPRDTRGLMLAKQHKLASQH